MARYVVLLDWTDQGVRSAVKDTVQRVAHARTAWEPLGVRIETIYWTLGDHDLVAVIDAPDVNHWIYHFRPNACVTTVIGGITRWNSQAHGPNYSS